MFNPRMLGQFGRRGDTMIAHISPQEAAILKMLGGSGSINPKTGLMEFYGGDNGGDGSDSDGGRDAGGDPGSGAGSGEGGPDGGAFGGGFDGSADAYGEAEAFGINSGLSEENQANLSAILGDMQSTAEANNAIGAGFFTDPLAYTPALIGNLAKGAKAGFGNFAHDPMGYTLEAMTPSAKTIGTLLGMYSPMPFGGLVGNYIGGLADTYGFSAPEKESEDTTARGNDYGALAQNMVSGTSGVSQAQAEGQPASAPSFDRDAFGQFGSGVISSQGKAQQAGTKSDAARRGMGADSGQIAGQMAINRQQQQEKMRQFNQMMGDPNMGYNDLASSLMNILA